VGLSYINLKIKKIENFYKLNYTNGRDFKIYKTSIVDKYFFETYNIILDIITSIMRKEAKVKDQQENQQEVKLLEKNLFVLLNFKKKIYEEKQLSKEFNIKESDLKIQLFRLEKIGFITRSLDSNKLQFTERACFFKKGLEEEIKRFDSPDFNKGVDSINKILYINKEKIKI
jgi:hypothetical protein